MRGIGEARPSLVWRVAGAADSWTHRRRRRRRRRSPPGRPRRVRRCRRCRWAPGAPPAAGRRRWGRRWGRRRRRRPRRRCWRGRRPTSPAPARACCRCDSWRARRASREQQTEPRMHGCRPGHEGASFRRQHPQRPSCNSLVWAPRCSWQLPRAETWLIRWAQKKLGRGAGGQGRGGRGEGARRRDALRPQRNLENARPPTLSSVPPPKQLYNGNSTVTGCWDVQEEHLSRGKARRARGRRRRRGRGCHGRWTGGATVFLSFFLS